MTMEQLHKRLNFKKKSTFEIERLDTDDFEMLTTLIVMQTCVENTHLRSCATFMSI